MYKTFVAEDKFVTKVAYLFENITCVRLFLHGQFNWLIISFSFKVIISIIISKTSQVFEKNATNFHSLLFKTYVGKLRPLKEFKNNFKLQ